VDYIERAKRVIEDEIEGLGNIRDHLGAEFEELVERCLKVLRQDGKIVLCGIGKSGLVGRKIAATLASTGAPAVFMHPVEAMHGDLGMLGQKDILLCLSYSGETEELLAALPAAKRFHIPIVAVTGDPDSQLAAWSDLTVPMPVPREACPFNLAPTTSTTALLTLGDALAIVLLEARGFSQEDYGRLHPAGAIGRTVTLTVADVMRGLDRTPVVTPDTTVHDALMKMTKCRAGSVLITDDDGALAGIFTDGDFRRHAQEDLNVLHEPISKVMTREPAALQDRQMAVDILNLLETRSIDDIPVVDKQGHLVGLVAIQDLPRFKLMVDTRE
jgi:arabinose-5-phosphate isomerase